MVDQELPAVLAIPGPRAERGFSCQALHLSRHARSAHRDLPDPLDLQALKDCQDRKEMQDHQERTDCPDCLVPQGHKALKDLLALQATKDHPESPER